MNPLSFALCRRPVAALLMPVAGLLSGCSSGPLATYFAGTRYNCDNGVVATVRSDGSATLQTGRGTEVLLRDAGGVGPEQAVYSNPQVRLETGLPPGGLGARLEGLVVNGAARCTKQTFMTR